jgi:hypothetical protein
MRLKLYKRNGIYHYRGTIAKKRIRASTGTSNKTRAERIAAEAEDAAWKGRLDGPSAVLTFAQAVLKYRAAGKQARFLPALEDYWKETLVRDISEGAIIQCSLDLYPKAKAATRNRHVIVPMRAIINHSARLRLCNRISVEQFETVKVTKRPVTLDWVESFMAASSPHLGALALFMFILNVELPSSKRPRLATQMKLICPKSLLSLLATSSASAGEMSSGTPPKVL